VIEIEIPEVAPSLNKLIRLHWAARRKLQQRWSWLILSKRPSIVTAPKKAKVVINRQSPKFLDTDNLYGASKMIVDALKHAALISGDDPSRLTLVCTQSRGKAETKITVDVDNEPIK
jgi:hypothetical protein